MNWGIKVLQTTDKMNPVVEVSAKKVPPIMKPMKRRRSGYDWCGWRVVSCSRHVPARKMDQRLTRKGSMLNGMGSFLLRIFKGG